MKQESLVTWVQSTEGLQEYKLISFKEFYGAHHNYFCGGMEDTVHPMYSAFTVAELGNMLPYEIGGKLLDMSKGSDGTWSVYYTKNTLGAVTEPTFIEDQGADTEADARAKMLIYLVENGLLR